MVVVDGRRGCRIRRHLRHLRRGRRDRPHTTYDARDAPAVADFLARVARGPSLGRLPSVPATELPFASTLEDGRLDEIDALMKEVAEGGRGPTAYRSPDSTSRPPRRPAGWCASTDRIIGTLGDKQGGEHDGGNR
jgi:hypothetical protein